MNNFLGKWLFYPWLKNSGLDHLISSEDLNGLQGLGVVQCVKEDSDFLFVTNNEGTFRVKSEGVSKVLPDPKFYWGDKVKIVGSINESEFVLNDFFWHHKRGEYLYYIHSDEQKKSKQYKDTELAKVNFF